MSSYFLHNERCPRCASKGDDLSKDNLAVYSDEHKYCFKCGYYVRGDKTLQLKERNDTDTLTPSITDFNKATLKYLKSYGLTDEEIQQHLRGHEDGYMFIDSNFYSIRRLDKKPKVITQGKVVGNEPIFLNDNGGTTVIICEDVLSAIKIARVGNSCALMKTAIHDVLLHRLATYFERCYLWLDNDVKEHVMTKLYPKLVPYFKEVRIITSEYDPKVYNTKEIERFINE
jgi:hypothetical protein